MRGLRIALGIGIQVRKSMLETIENKNDDNIYVIVVSQMENTNRQPYLVRGIFEFSVFFGRSTTTFLKNTFQASLWHTPSATDV